jgi:hypothetical protein
VAIYRLMDKAEFPPDQIKAMAIAYESALMVLRVNDRGDPVTELLAQKIFERARNGERDPIELRNYALEAEDDLN